MFWHNFFWPYDSEYILMHLLSKYYNTNMICSTDTQYVSTQTWSVLQTHNILQYYHDLFGRFVQNIKNRMCIFWVSRIYFCFTWANFMSNMINHNYVLTQLFLTSWLRIYFDAPVVKILQYKHDLFYRHTIRFNAIMICSTDTQYITILSWSLRTICTKY